MSDTAITPAATQEKIDTILKDLGSKQMEFMKDTIIGGGDNMQTCIAVDSRANVSMIVCPWNSYEDRSKTLTMLRLFMVANDIVGYVFCSEAWVASNDVRDEAGNRIMPKDREDRREALIVTTISDTLKTHQVVEIERLNDPVSFKDDENAAGMDLSGDLFELMPPKEARADPLWETKKKVAKILMDKIGALENI